MRRILFSAALAGLLALGCASPPGENIEAVTRDGRPVTLHTDGTWSYQDVSPPRETRPEQASESHRSTTGLCELWYKPAVWKPGPMGHPSAELSLLHFSGDARAILVAEPLQATRQQLKNLALANARKGDPDARVVQEKTWGRNDRVFLNVRIDLTVKDIPMTLYAFYWTGEKGSVQLIFYTGRNLFGHFESDFNQLFKGLFITV